MTKEHKNTAKSSHRKVLRIVGWIMLILLPIYIIPLFAVLSAGYTSFMAAAVVKPMAQSYIADTFPGEDLYVERTAYSFKGNIYYADIASRSSIDTHFTIQYDMGWPEYTYDTYSYVTDGTNTFFRLENEYDQLVRNASANAEGLYHVHGNLCEYRADGSSATSSPDGLDCRDLILDMEGDFDMLGSEYGIISCAFTAPAAAISPDYAHSLICDFDNVLTAAGVKYKAIDFTLYPADENGEPDYQSDARIHLPNVTAEDIASGMFTALPEAQ